MSTKTPSLPEMAEFSFTQLAAVASDLNDVSDELGKSITEIDSSLKKLNLGVSVWIRVGGWDNPQEMEYFREQLGYAKVNGKWGIALRTIAGDDNHPDQEHIEAWLFNDGPRTLRLTAIEKLPEMLLMLSKEALETAGKIKNKLAEVQEVARAITVVANRPIVKLSPRPLTSPFAPGDVAKGGKK
jgi:hypothetical protein